MAESKQRGVFVSFEGTDGVGKSTQVGLLASVLTERGRDVVSLREPGGTQLSEKIRQLLLSPSESEMCPECELLLFEASRAQLVREVIEPALSRGSVVLCDRFFDSTFAYQAGGRGLDAGLVQQANRLGCCGIVPDRTLVFDLDTAEALTRATKQGADRLEAEGLRFERQVRNAYLTLARDDPDRVRVVDASGSQREVANRVCAELDDLIPELMETTGGVGGVAAREH